MHISLLLLIALAATATVSAQSRSGSARLRDITIAADEKHATITLLLRGRAATVVTEIKQGNAQIRMRPLAADRAALRSARLRDGVRSVRAHIERRDVLVVDVDFARTARRMTVVRRTDSEVVVDVALGEVSEPAQTATSTPGSRRNHRRWALSTIVIDAGHGGKDPGAIGLGGILEKDVTLSVAKLLKREIERTMKGVRVVMTRGDDRFVELFRRGQIANENDGRFFISIHCNALPDSVRSANGFECYILRPGRSDDAARVVAEENAAIRFESDQKKYVDTSAESAIVASMAQSAFARYSEQAAQQIRTSLRAGTRLADRGVHQAGFFVLVGASMPAVLLEIGYLSSEIDIKTLKTTGGRKSIAQSIARGIRRYETIYSKSLE